MRAQKNFKGFKERVRYDEQFQAHERYLGSREFTKLEYTKFVRKLKKTMSHSMAIHLSFYDRLRICIKFLFFKK